MVFQTRTVFGMVPAKLLPVPGRDKDLVNRTQLAGQADPDQKVHPQQGGFGHASLPGSSQVMAASGDMLRCDFRQAGSQEQAQDICPAPGQAKVISVSSLGPQVQRLGCA